MTTLAYRDGILASDSLTTRGNTSVKGIAKLFKSDSVLVGICGSLHDIPKFSKWILETSDKCDSVADFYLHGSPLDGNDDTEALIADHYGNCWFMHPSGNVFQYDKEYAAAGSGDYFALGALHMGATAEEAVAASIELDLYTGGNIKSISF